MIEIKRVVVTGMGIVTSLGNDVFTNWLAIINGQSGVGTITGFDPSFLPVQIAAEIKGFDPNAFLPPKEARRIDRSAQLAVFAAQQAVKDAGLKMDGDAEHVGVFMGTGIGGFETTYKQITRYNERGPDSVSPFFIPMMMPNAAAGQIAIYLGAKGSNFGLSSACASATHALGEAAAAIKRGDAKVMIAGGSEAVILPIVIAAFANMRAMSRRNNDPEKASRPFDANRDGMVIGEGAGILVLEDLDYALARGAKIYAELVGYGSSCDANHIVAPAEDGKGAAQAMRIALKKANILPWQVDYINAHGTSTPANDLSETRAIKEVFEKEAYRIPISSTKSMTGHLLGAAGAIEAIFTILTINHGTIPPTINYETPDPECDLDYVPNKVRKQPVNVALSNSFGFGGHNGTLVFRGYPN